MKIKAINTYKTKDGQTRWKIDFEDDDKPLIMGWQPKFRQGDDIPDERLKATSKGSKEYYIWKKEISKRGSYNRHSPDAEDWTTIRTALMQAVELEKLYPRDKLNPAETLQVSRELFAGMCEMKPVREHEGNK